jgi:hypothetical protein
MQQLKMMGSPGIRVKREKIEIFISSSYFFFIMWTVEWIPSKKMDDVSFWALDLWVLVSTYCGFVEH